MASIRRRSRRAVVLVVGLILMPAPAAASAIGWGTQYGIPGAYSWNYGDSLDFSGAPATPGFGLHDVFISDASTPQAAYQSSSHDGITWTTPTRLSGGAVNAEGASIAAAGTKVVVGWVTGFSAYDPAGAPRRLQVNTSADGGATWRGVKSLTPARGRIDYPIVAAARTAFGPVNMYAVWVDATNGKVYFRERSGAAAWSVPIPIGATTLANREGYHGYANVAAVGNLITVAWIADATGSLQARQIGLSGKTPTAAATRANWNASVVLAGRVSLRQGGYPVVSASPLAPGLVTIAWNTPTKQVYTTFDGTHVTATPITIWVGGIANAIAYTGGYATVVEPAPGGFIAMWAGCRDRSLTNDCNGRQGVARVDLLSATSANGTLFSFPSLVAPATRNGRTVNDQASVVATADHVYAQYNGSTANFGRYDVFDRIGTGSP